MMKNSPKLFRKVFGFHFNFYSYREFVPNKMIHFIKIKNRIWVKHEQEEAKKQLLLAL